MQIARFVLRLLVVPVLLVAAPARAQESAIDAARAAAKSSPGDARSALVNGRVLLRAGHPADAAAELRRGANLLGGRTGDTAIALHYELARAAIAQRDFGQAMVQCRVASSLPGGAASGHACAAEAHLLWKRASEALVETAQALAGGVKSVDAKLAEGHARELELKEADAEAAFRDAAKWAPDSVDAHVALGRLLVATGNADAGIAELRRALQISPVDPEASYELGRALPLGDEAATALERAVRERPTFKDALLRLSETQIALGRVAEARKAAQAGLKLDPQDTNMRIIAGKVLLAEGKPDLAITEANAALAIIPNLALAKLLVADAFAKKGEIDLAVESYQAAYGFDHSDPTPLVHASGACHAAGRDTSAKAFGEKATKEFPAWGPGWVALADALAADGEIDRARAAYETALKSRGPLDAASVKQKIEGLPRGRKP